jgi:hypothetical protein
MRKTDWTNLTSFSYGKDYTTHNRLLQARKFKNGSFKFRTIYIDTFGSRASFEGGLDFTTEFQKLINIKL